MGAAMLASQLIQPVAGAMIAGIGGKAERRFRKNAMAEMEAGKGGAGGMSAGRLGQRRAEGTGQIQSQERTALANAMRAGSPEERLAAAQNVYRQGVGARAADESGLRAADLQEAAARRAQASGDMAKAIQFSQNRKMAAAGIIAGAKGVSAAPSQQAGQASRVGDADEMNQGAAAIGSAGTTA